MATSLLNLSLLVSMLFLGPCKDTYIIEIPNNISIVEDGYIDINVVENDLSQYETLYIDFDQTFTISDSHGKEDISGYTTDSSIIIEAGDTSGKTVGYHLPPIPAGEWSGNLGLSIRLENTCPGNILISGKLLNQYFTAYGPTCIEFSNQVIDTCDRSYDISLAKDSSVMLYEIDAEKRIIISNDVPVKIKANQDMSELFKDITTLTEIRNIDFLDLSECDDISKMFSGANRVSTISGLSDLDTSNIENMSHLFEGTTRLRTIDLSDWEVSNVKDMSHMFNNSYISDFSSIYDWNTSNVEDMNSMFYQCRQLTSLDLSSWGVSKVKDMSRMFSQLRRLANLDLSSWDTTGCQNMASMFESSQNLTTIIGLSLLDTENVQDMSGMFSSCIGLNSMDISGFETGNVLNMSKMFDKANLSDLGDISGWDVGKVTSFESMFRDCPNLQDLDDIQYWNVSNQCNDLSMMFYNSALIAPQDLDLTGWDVSNVTTTAGMFYGSKSLETLDITGWDTSKLVNASGMFEYNSVIEQSRLSEINGIEDLDISSLKNISRMFMLNRFVNVDLSSWDTHGLEDISYAFSGCYRQDLGKLKHWNVSSVIDMSNCFADNAGSISGTAVPDWYIS